MQYQLKGNSGGLIKKKILFGTPAKDVVIKIGETIDDLFIDEVEVIENGNIVLVRGYLNKVIKYLTVSRDALSIVTEKEYKEDKDFKEEEDNKKFEKELICDLISNKLQDMAIDGVMRHTTLWIPFEILINIEGVKVDNEVIIDSMTVESLFKNNQSREIIEDNLIVGVLIKDFISVSIGIK